MPHINGYNGLVTAVETALGQPIPEPAPARRRRKPLPFREIKPPTKWARSLVFYNCYKLSEAPEQIPPGGYYLTDRKLDGLVTIRYTDTGLAQDPETRDPGLRYAVFGAGQKPSYALLAKLKCVLDTRGGPDAAAFCLLRRPDQWFDRQDPRNQLVLPIEANLHSHAEYARPTYRRGNSVRDLTYRWHIALGTLPPKLIPSRAVRLLRQAILAVPVAHDYIDRLNAQRGYDRILESI